MIRSFIAACLVVTGVIHVLPVSGLLGPERLMALYGVAINDPDLAILMRHRAALLGLLGALLIVAAFRPALQRVAFIAGFVSVVSFLWLAWAAGAYNPFVARVVAADWVALACLTAGAIALAWSKRAPRHAA